MGVLLNFLPLGWVDLLAEKTNKANYKTLPYNTKTKHHKFQITSKNTIAPLPELCIQLTFNITTDYTSLKLQIMNALKI